MSTTTSITDVMRSHDDDPVGAAQTLASLAVNGIAEADLARYTWLVNHVVGEKLGEWPRALALHRQSCRGSTQGAVLRDFAVAALLAGEALDAWQGEANLAAATGSSAAHALLAVRLGAMMHVAPTVPARQLSVALNHCVAILRSLGDAGTLGVMLAGALNNIVSSLLDKPEVDANDPVVREALLVGAHECKKLWQEAGAWANRERADYLIALCSNKVGNWFGAQQAVESGLATIAANGPEEVDRAFLLLELARAYRGQGRLEDHATARKEAFALAERFDEPGLREWFDSRAAAL